MELLKTLWGRFVRRPGLPSHLLALGIWKPRLPLRARFCECRDFDTDLNHLRTCSGFATEAGFVYSPDRRPVAGEEWGWELTDRHFRGPWYIWRWSD